MSSYTRRSTSTTPFPPYFYFSPREQSMRSLLDVIFIKLTLICKPTKRLRFYKSVREILRKTGLEMKTKKFFYTYTCCSKVKRNGFFRLLSYKNDTK